MDGLWSSWHCPVSEVKEEKASMIGRYPVHLHRLPWRPEKMSSMSGVGHCLRTPSMDITIPGEQKPH